MTVSMLVITLVIWGLFCLMAGVCLGRIVERNAQVLDASRKCEQARVRVDFRPVTFRCRNCGETLKHKYDASKGAYVCSVCNCETRPEVVASFSDV